MALWGRHETMALIQLYRTKSCLWMITNPDYRHHSKRKIALDDIASEMQIIRPGITAKEVQAKINGLRTQYSDQLRKQHKTRGLGSANSKVLWCFSALQFLRHFVVPRHTTGNWQADEDDEGDVAWESSLRVDHDLVAATEEEDVVSSEPRKRIVMSDVIPLRKKLKTHLFNGRQRMPKLSLSTMTTTLSSSPVPSVIADDNFALFGAYIASELRSLKDPTQQHLAQMDIQRVIFQRKCPLLRITCDRSTSLSPVSLVSVKAEPGSPPVTESGALIQDSFNTSCSTPPPPAENGDGTAAQYCMAYIPL